MPAHSKSVLGSVESIISHVKPDWWTSVFQETYLRTDGDVVENPANTESECLEILNNPLVKVLWTKNAGGTDGVSSGTVKVGDEMKRDVSSLHVLDLCCGQGRHTICLAQHLPGAKFHGHDHSVFLVNLARARVRAAGLDGDVMFTTGYANDVPVDPETFDLVLMMGNSLGYGESVDDAKTLREVYRVLKPGGLFLLDLPDAKRMIDGVKDRSWEWIDGRDLAALMANELSEPHLDGAYDRGKNIRKLLACRERELSAKKDKLATREIVIDLERGIMEDLFYSVHLYKLADIADLLGRCGLFTSTDIPDNSTNNIISKQPRPDSSRDEDLGMMEHRYLVTAQKPNFAAQDLTISIGDDLDFYVHPALTIRSDPYKGKLICAATHIRAGTLLIVDKPYACVPSIDPVSEEWFVCSRHECSRRIPRTADAVSGRVACLRHCNPEVVWCNASCRDLDEKRHALECEWLASYTNVIVNRHGKYDFNMLWTVTRILVRRRLELQQNGITIPADLVSVPDGKGIDDPVKSPIEVQPTDAQSSSPPFGNNTWPVIQDSILSNRDRFPSQRIKHWNFLASTYLTSQPFCSTQSSSSSTLDTSSIVDIICKEETNSFCLYPKPTGIVPVPTEGGIPLGKPTRGTPYGLAFYTRATLFNHSCIPNVMHSPDAVGRMTMHATRDILAGEECCIAYFDLQERWSLEARQELLDNYFLFTCECGRCVRERQERRTAST